MQTCEVIWRVTLWVPTSDGRWRLEQYEDFKNGDWAGALATARSWCKDNIADIEAKLAKVKLQPFNVTLKTVTA